MKIRIVIWSRTNGYSVHADDQTNDFTINESLNNVGVKDFVKKAINLVSKWKDSYVDKNAMDGINYKIVYNDGNIERNLIGSNATPDNFNELLQLIEFYKTPTTIDEKLKRESKVARETIKMIEIFNRLEDYNCGKK